MDINLHETQNIIDATKEQIYLQGKTHTGKCAKPRRGQVFNCYLGVGVGSEFQKRRPCIVLSNTVSNINTSVVVVAPITHTHKNYPVFVPIEERRDTNGTVVLSGYADLSNVRAISSYRLAGLVCELSSFLKISPKVDAHVYLWYHNVKDIDMWGQKCYRVAMV